MNVFQIEKKPTLTSIIRDTPRVNQYDIISEKFITRVFHLFRAGLTSKEIANKFDCRVAKVNSVIESFNPLIKVEQVTFGRKNESQDEMMYSGILPKYNSYELSAEELDIFNEGSAYKFKLEYEKE
jgi:hypothetical protein